MRARACVCVCARAHAMTVPRGLGVLEGAPRLRDGARAVAFRVVDERKIDLKDDRRAEQ